MINKKQEDLQDVLKYCKLTKLPTKWDKETSKKIWVDAILEIRKCNGSTSYAYAENRYGLTPRYKKVWGDMASIVEVISYHPIHYLEKDFIVEFKDMDELRSKIASLYGMSDEGIAGIDDEKVVSMAYNYAIESQIVFIQQKGKDEYKQQKMQENEKIFKEITESKTNRRKKKN